MHIRYIHFHPADSRIHTETWSVSTDWTRRRKAQHTINWAFGHYGAPKKMTMERKEDSEQLSLFGLCHIGNGGVIWEVGLSVRSLLTDNIPLAQLTRRKHVSTFRNAKIAVPHQAFTNTAVLPVYSCFPQKLCLSFLPILVVMYFPSRRKKSGEHFESIKDMHNTFTICRNIPGIYPQLSILYS